MDITFNCTSCGQELAADEAAVKGDPQRGLLLASVLVRIAKWKPARPALLLSCIVSDGLELSARVQFLLGHNALPGHTTPAKHILPSSGRILATTVVCPLAMGLLFATRPELLVKVFELLEKALR